MTGAALGDGVFTTLRVENPFPCFWIIILPALNRPAKFFGIIFSDPGFSEIITRLLKQNQLKDARVKIMVTRGCDPENRIYNYEGEPCTILALCFPLSPRLLKPMRLGLSPELRGNESIHRHKTISYLSNLTHKTIARKNGFDDAIILNSEKKNIGNNNANIFFIVKDKIITPPRELPL